MRAKTIASSVVLLSGLLSSADVLAVTIQTHSTEQPQAMTANSPGTIQLAAGAGTADKSMQGKTGGRYGIGGSECKAPVCAKPKH